MEADELPPISPDVDYEQILPIQQKRTVAFVNHFIMSTVSFLNAFCQSCESRLMQFEYKMQKLEASLLILESQLASIPDLDDSAVVKTSTPPVDGGVVEENDGVVDLVLPEIPTEQCEEGGESEGPRACEDPRFKRFFKMVQFGVPPPAVKLKMQSEGFDPSILDKPNEVIPGHVVNDNNETDSNNS